MPTSEYTQHCVYIHLASISHLHGCESFHRVKIKNPQMRKTSIGFSIEGSLGDGLQWF